MSDLQDDIAILRKIKESLEDENRQLDAVLEQIQVDVEEATRGSVGQMVAAGKELEEIEKEAEEEENQGQIAAVQQNISDM